MSFQEKKCDIVPVLQACLFFKAPQQQVFFFFVLFTYQVTECSEVQKTNTNLSGSSDPALQENSVSMRTKQSAVIYRCNIFIQWPFLEKCNLSVHKHQKGENVDRREREREMAKAWVLVRDGDCRKKHHWVHSLVS